MDGGLVERQKHTLCTALPITVVVAPNRMMDVDLAGTLETPTKPSILLSARQYKREGSIGSIAAFAREDTDGAPRPISVLEHILGQYIDCISTDLVVQVEQVAWVVVVSLEA